MATAREVLNKIGGPQSVAKRLGVTTQAVYKWVADNKIPPGRAIQLCREYKGLLDLDDIPTERAA